MRFELLPPVPAVTLARRLREIPLFRFISVDELFRISNISRQVRYEANASVQDRGGPAEYIQVLLDGRLRVENGRRQTKSLPPPAMLGFREVLEGTVLEEKAWAEMESIALVMPAEEFRTLLSANIELAQGLFRMLLSEKAEEKDGPSVMRAPKPLRHPGSSDSLTTVDKVMHLQTIPLLSRATGDELYAIAAIAREVALVPDQILFAEGDPPSILFLLSGEVVLERPGGGQAITIEPGGCLGVSETLAGTTWSRRARAVRAGKALEIEREAIFDLLADRMDLLQGIFGAIFHKSENEPEAASNEA